MSDSLEFIDSYFNNELSDQERKEFELRCSTDEPFAQEVAFYISARGAVRDSLLEQKKKEWQHYSVAAATKPNQKPLLLSLMPYAAAACLIAIVAFSFLLKTPERLTSKYVDEKYESLSQTMDATRDSLQLGLAEYNNKNYDRAAVLFDKVKQMNPDNADAKKYAGLAYLKTKNYDAALERFKELSAMKDLHSNSGNFLQATTLLQRHASGDKEAAKALLEKVVSEKEDGFPVAEKALEKW